MYTIELKTLKIFLGVSDVKKFTYTGKTGFISWKLYEYYYISDYAAPCQIERCVGDVSSFCISVGWKVYEF